MSNSAMADEGKNPGDLSCAPFPAQPKVGRQVTQRAHLAQPALSHLRKSSVYDKNNQGFPHSEDQDP